MEIRRSESYGMKKYIRYVRLMQCAFVALAVGTGGCNAREAPADWKAECVGRMQVSLPGDVDVAGVSKQSWLKSRSVPGSVAVYAFADEQKAEWSDLGFLGEVLITHPLSQSDLKTFTQEIERGRLTVKKFNDKLSKETNKRAFSDLPVASQNGYAWGVENGTVAQLFVATHYFSWDSYSDLAEVEQRQHFQTIIDGLSYRGPHSLTSTPGVCIPYAFIRDDGKSPRHISMTYRLREHPDVTIMLKDASAVEVDTKANPKVYDPESVSDSFWSRYDNAYRKSLRGAWSTPYKRIKMAGAKGVVSFVKIVREDDAVDYGYLVVARGDPKAKEDTPDLMLYVIQDSKNAKAKGIKPIGKDEFLEMAQTIAASVKRRPVSR